MLLKLAFALVQELQAQDVVHFDLVSILSEALQLPYAVHKHNLPQVLGIPLLLQKCDNILLEALPSVSESDFWAPPSDCPPFRVVLADFGESRRFGSKDAAATIRQAWRRHKSAWGGIMLLLAAALLYMGAFMPWMLL